MNYFFRLSRFWYILAYYHKKIHSIRLMGYVQQCSIYLVMVSVHKNLMQCNFLSDKNLSLH